MRKSDILKPVALGLALTALGTSAYAAPMTYNIDPNHTYPTFETDHNGGVSLWRGKINSSSGTITLDKEAKTGMVQVSMDMSTIDVGLDALNSHLKSADFFDVDKYPTATYTGKLTDWRDGAPTAVEGELTLHGVTKPVNLKIDRFLCKPNPMAGGNEVCGANVVGTIDRSDFGVSFAGQPGFMDVTLRISVEASPPRQRR